MNILNVIEQIGKQEDTLSEKVIISPVFHNNKIVSQIENLTHLIEIPRKTPGWYIFRPIDTMQAKYVSVAETSDIQKYLKRLKKIRVILVHKKEQIYYGIPIKSNNTGFKTNELLPILLPDDMASDFTRCLCRFDGLNIWYDQTDMSTDSEKAEYLTESFRLFHNPKSIKYTGLTIEEKTAYAIKYEIRKKSIKERKKENIQTHVEHAGGKFISSKEKTEHLSVTYEVDGKTYTSLVAKNNRHKIITAGICLTDDDDREGDTDFDLKSIISVIREGQKNGLIHRTL